MQSNCFKKYVNINISLKKDFGCMFIIIIITSFFFLKLEEKQNVFLLLIGNVGQAMKMNG